MIRWVGKAGGRNGFLLGGQQSSEVLMVSGEKKEHPGREELLGKVFSLKDLVAYQDGTVASRMIIFKDAGNITLFSFDEGEGLSEHTAPFDAVVTILDGECEVWVAGETHRLKEGETIIFPANKPHALSAVTKFKMMLTMIRECPK
jgi:quercetin dioxygenase-like cupin family protein